MPARKTPPEGQRPQSEDFIETSRERPLNGCLRKFLRSSLWFSHLIHPRSHLLHDSFDDQKNVFCLICGIVMVQMHRGVSIRVLHSRERPIKFLKKPTVARQPRGARRRPSLVYFGLYGAQCFHPTAFRSLGRVRDTKRTRRGSYAGLQASYAVKSTRGASRQRKAF
jgi:hypothetical protein